MTATTSAPAALPVTKPQTVTYDTSTAVVLTTKAQALDAGAVELKIDSPALFDIAVEDLRKVKTLQKDVEASRTSITGPLNAALKAVNDLYRKPTQYLDNAERMLKAGISTYQIEQERIAEEARKDAEAQAEAERERLAEEEARQRENADRASEEAAAALAVGDTEAAQRALSEADSAAHLSAAAQLSAAVVTAVPRVVAHTKAAGLSGRKTYAAEVTDLMQLVKAVAEGQAPINALQADATFLRSQANAFKKAGPLYPGVNVTETRSVAARAA